MKKSLGRAGLWIATIMGVMILLLLTAVLTQPRGRATLRLVSGFTQLEEDPRIFYEPGALGIARRIAVALPGSIARVGELQSRPLEPGFRVYVCASHESFSRRVGQPVNFPVRGIAFLWDIWVSPQAFDFHGRDTHAETLAHELSHLHLVQHLGWLDKTRQLPAWFVEGLADWVADTGAEVISRDEAVARFSAPPHLVPDANGQLPLPKGARDYGLSWPLFHMQSRLFIEYLYARDQRAFDRFVAALVDGALFGEAFRTHFGDTLDGVWGAFLEHVRQDTSRSGA